jgi:CBS domain-containing protein
MDLDAPVTTLMSRDLVTVRLGQALSEARRVMAERGVHHVPVVEGAQLVGMLSSADLLRVAAGSDPVPLQVGGLASIATVMVRDVVTLRPDATVCEALELFAVGRFHSLPVVDDGVLVGLVTATDLLRHLFEQSQQERPLASVIDPSTPLAPATTGAGPRRPGSRP